MLTTELLGYIREQLAKNRTRDDIHFELIKNGWNEQDLDEAFRIVIPMNDSLAPNVGIQNTVPVSSLKHKKISKMLWEDLAFIVVGVLCVVAWHLYSPQIISFWNSGLDNINKLTASIFTSKKVENNEIIKNVVGVKDCGMTIAPDPNNPNTYQNDKVLECLGNSVLRCEDAKAVLNDALFPTIFQIIKDDAAPKGCNFRLSYGQESALMDVTGRKLAGQYITCPVSIVKSLDETKEVPVFAAPSLNNPNKYASQVYFYGTLGLFIENEINKSKIQSLGCSGTYIDSMILSYKKMGDNR